MWNTDLIETEELENLIGQTEQCQCGDEELTLTSFPERGDEQWMKHMPSERSRAEAKEALASAGTLDSKAASAFDAESSDLAINIDVLTRAIAALG